ncbi:hypothetical protein [Nocardia sp. NPDC050435]|uniref:hypothetical protein n=1 Tax=Nocardia sp. NPDC050435 TaxID=3155040 RepID=UPI00340371F5
MMGFSRTRGGTAVLTAVLALMTATAACGRVDDPALAGDTWLTTSAISPSGRYRATIQPAENLMATISILETSTGAQTCTVGTFSRSRNHRFGVGWLTTEPDRLFVYSGDVAHHQADRTPTGQWTLSTVPEQNLPAEVRTWW